MLRDLERVERKRENLQALEEQILLTRELKAHCEQQDTAETVRSAQGS